MFDDLMQYRVASFPESPEILPVFSISDEDENTGGEKYPGVLPILALKNTVLYPGLVIPITVGRTKSNAAVKKAFDGDKFVAVFTQKDIKIKDPGSDDLYKIGTVAKVLKLLTMPDGSTTAILQGRQKIFLNILTKTEPYLEGNVTVLEDNLPKSIEFDATMASIKDIARKIIELSPQIPSEAVMMLQNIKSNRFLLNFIASNLNLNIEKKQKILELNNLEEKADIILRQMDTELQMLEIKDQIESKVRGDIEKQQRDYFLNQQLKTIQEELGQNPMQEEIKELKARSKKKDWPEYVAKHFEKEMNKVKRMNPQVAEYSITMNYLEVLLDLPWNECTKDNFNLRDVQKVLDKDHYGLEDVKDRIIEHLAVLKLKGDMKAPILLLVGPPGVGKTSLGKSVARALKRNFIRMSLGGLHDESEIRGHRKTYIGAMPGRIIQSIKKAKSSNPVFILDEIDKVGKDFRGDPSSALLEVLDPEQNSTFYDNFLELDYNLSKVLFIATANSLNTIQPALLDRMEIIEINGYSQEEKVQIAKKHLVPKQLKAHGLKASDIRITPRIMAKLINEYTRESGVRALDRVIARVMRRIAKNKAMDIAYNASLKETDVRDILGPARFQPDREARIDVSGVAIGLAWTRVGGDILFIESSLSKGKGKLTLTGNLGDVMKESATTALSYIKANCEAMGIDPKSFETNDIHIHVPQGAIPKDGPSAGVTMLTSLVSLFREKTVRKDIAMSGEITLRGKVLPVGGIKEKVLAAKRSGLHEIILSVENEKDVSKIKEEYIKDMRFIYVDRMEEVLTHALDIVPF